ncbi:ABC transporter substrate-binding protein [Allosediminivita pacifica]|uniref:Maltose-binding protein /trehalose-binding protein /sucrose-binding protein n=1 Tax=Allosediminivita pacifica TaxID=1267769 RepID=A0A2T6AT01_9RHOB|nr:ABC transporter substrate-binding protein [Allosediminivita pacifica]PTX46944.1 maltose-binding protein /trehalose-binding protein /sucrose-binding protein [Allosediminivita pacifica]GGB15005.1 alpha-glucoside ABC transporter substrate-binding protein [Allosediminivita pacifica]
MKSVLLTGAAALAICAGTAQAQDLVFAPGEGDFNWDSFESFSGEYDLSGETVEVTGPWTGRDAELVNSVMAYFEEATGATVNFSGSDSFEQDIVIAARAGSAPNVAVFPQPGLASDMASQGYLTPLPEGTADWMQENYAAGQSWVDLGSYEGPEGEENYYGFFYKVDVKSVVWYSESAFDEMGYDIPETMEELKELTEQIVDDGGTPWCIGLGSGAATGWPATDWVEDMMLRTQPPEVYDQWVENEIPFDDPAVVGAIEEFGWFAKNDDYVQGGSQAVATTDFRESPAGLFTIPPECYMHRQASFIPTFFPEDNDSSFFYFPAYEEKDLGQPVLGAGTLWAITGESEGANALIEFLKTPIAHEVWMAQSGFLTPHTGVNTELYANETLKGLGDILLGASTFRFDASDLMPGEIGAGAFWTGMVDYVTGTPAEEVGADIQDRWDSIQ